MSHPNRSIFRRNAVEHYIQNQEKQVLPRFISPRVFVYWWLLLLLLITGSTALWSIQLPTYVSGQAIIIEETDAGKANKVGRLLLFLPASKVDALALDQVVLITLDPENQRLPGRIIHVEEAVLSPQSAQQRFNLPAATVTKPVAVAIVQMTNFPPAKLANEYVGGLYPAQISVGVQRMVMLLPWVSVFFAEAYL